MWACRADQAHVAGDVDWLALGRASRCSCFAMASNASVSSPAEPSRDRCREPDTRPAANAPAPGCPDQLTREPHTRRGRPRNHPLRGATPRADRASAQADRVRPPARRDGIAPSALRCSAPSPPAQWERPRGCAHLRGRRRLSDPCRQPWFESSELMFDALKSFRLEGAMEVQFELGG